MYNREDATGSRLVNATLQVGDGALEFVHAIGNRCAELGFRCVAHLTFEMGHSFRLLGIGDACASGVVLGDKRGTRDLG